MNTHSSPMSYGKSDLAFLHSRGKKRGCTGVDWGRLLIRLPQWTPGWGGLSTLPLGFEYLFSLLLRPKEEKMKGKNNNPKIPSTLCSCAMREVEMLLFTFTMPCKILYTSIFLPLTHLFSELKSPKLCSLSSKSSFFFPSIISWTFSNSAMSFLRWGNQNHTH